MASAKFVVPGGLRLKRGVGRTRRSDRIIADVNDA